ncbi:carbohydrate ABC transporter permease [Paenibacillus yanchengensis]|uniref:Carbohydrate ABC transporter permease n=1 Tax=Paenibacillus yanchengensis TaxID=2035833 RepID=A0ABW4YLQ6_9BACL
MSTKLGGRIFDIFNYSIMILLMIACLYPFLLIVFYSLSDPAELTQASSFLYKPLGLQFEAYKAVFQNKMIMSGYRNTLFYVTVGTTLNVFITVMLAYALSRRGPMLLPFMTMMIVVTMFFSGGLIPTYLVMKQLGIVNTWLAMIVPGLVITYNLIIVRTYFKSIPEELEESARIDGANEFVIMLRIMMPLSMPIIAVMILYYGVGHWNAWFNASIYLTKTNLFPLQLVLRNILIAGDTNELLATLGTIKGRDMTEIVKYAAIVVTTAPILALYPFLQKHFVKGIMIGALKG